MHNVLNLEQRALLDELCDTFEQSWRKNAPITIESLLSELDVSLRAPLLRELLLLELELRAEQGELPARREYLERFPIERSFVLAAFRVSSDRRNGPLAESPTPPSSNTANTIRKVRCPQCHQPADVAVGAESTKVSCDGCGDQYRLVASDDSSACPTPLEALGRFELIERIGAGGFGTVWKAFDCELERMVAVKVPRSHDLDADEMEKFLREARATAQLRHPNIVAVHESGRIRDLVYIVSNLVDGVTLGDWIADRQLPCRESATMCATIAGALHHAHEHGIVHRDLKPANILVDAHGQPHLTDFGLARRELGEVTMTAEGVQLGTPAYMSPEQAQGDAHVADRRSDIYSLGVILYEMLTGERPFLGNVRMLIHQVIHEEPRSARRLNDRIPRDLETICMKCLQKSPGARYPTAAELGADLGRFLDGQTILARPVGPMGRGWRWCKRNSVVASLVASIILILFLGAVGATAGMLFANRLRVEAEVSATAAHLSALEAERNAVARDQLAQKERSQREKAEEANRFLVGLFQSADPIGFWEWGYRDKMEDAASLTAVEVVRRGVRQLNERANQPEVQAMMADTLGTVLCSLGDMVEGERLLTEALRYRRDHRQDQPLALAATLLKLGHLHHELAHYDIAEQMCREALHLRQQELGPNDLLVADSKFALAWTIGDMRRAGYSREDDIEQLLRDVVAIRKQHGQQEDRKTAIALSALAAVLISKGEKFDGIAALTEAMAIFQKHEGTKSASTAIVLYFRSELARKNQDYAEALRLSREIVDRLEPAVGNQHPFYGIALGNLAGRLRDAGEVDEAVQVMRRALNIAHRSPMRSHPKVIAGMVELADFQVHQGSAAKERQRADECFKEAEDLYEEALQNLSNLSGPTVKSQIELITQKRTKLREAQDQQRPVTEP